MSCEQLSVSETVIGNKLTSGPIVCDWKVENRHAAS